MIGDHQILVTIHSFANPTGRCVQCGGATPTLPGCCDVAFPVTLEQNCPIQNTCDTAVNYCLRALRSTGLCPQSEQMLAPTFLVNSRGSDFGSDFFGLDNPIAFNRTESWQVSYCCRIILF